MTFLTERKITYGVFPMNAISDRNNSNDIWQHAGYVYSCKQENCDCSEGVHYFGNKFGHENCTVSSLVM
jgi:hypothetical protein